MKVLISTSARTIDPIAVAKKEVAAYAKEISALQKKMAASQSVIDKEIARLNKIKEKADATAAKGAAKGVMFFGVKGDKTQGKPTANLSVAANFARGRGKVYAVKGRTKEYIAYWDSMRNGKPIKGFALHFTKAGNKYASLYKA